MQFYVSPILTWLEQNWIYWVFLAYNQHGYFINVSQFGVAEHLRPNWINVIREPKSRLLSHIQHVMFHHVKPGSVMDSNELERCFLTEDRVSTLGKFLSVVTFWSLFSCAAFRQNKWLFVDLQVQYPNARYLDEYLGFKMVSSLNRFCRHCRSFAVTTPW